MRYQWTARWRRDPDSITLLGRSRDSMTPVQAERQLETFVLRYGKTHIIEMCGVDGEE